MICLALLASAKSRCYVGVLGESVMTVTKLDRSKVFSRWLPKLTDDLLRAEPEIVAIV